MRKFQHILFAAGVLLFSSFVALSAETSEKKGLEKVSYEKNTKLDFEDRDVDGQFLSPDGRAVKGEKNLYFDSMFEDRKNFSKELLRSSEAVR